jgi:hypothetical protein
MDCCFSHEAPTEDPIHSLKSEFASVSNFLGNALWVLAKTHPACAMQGMG